MTFSNSASTSGAASTYGAASTTCADSTIGANKMVLKPTVASADSTGTCIILRLRRANAKN